MGNYVDLNSSQSVINTERDNVVIRHVYETKIGGCVLDVEGFADSVIEAGHLVIFNPTTKVYKPMPVSGEAYATLPEGFQYFGFVIATILKNKPAAGVVTRGSVNPACMKYPLGSIASAVKSALPHITFVED